MWSGYLLLTKRTEASQDLHNLRFVVLCIYEYIKFKIFFTAVNFYQLICDRPTLKVTHKNNIKPSGGTCAHVSSNLPPPFKKIELVFVLLF